MRDVNSSAQHTASISPSSASATANPPTSSSSSSPSVAGLPPPSASSSSSTPPAAATQTKSPPEKYSSVDSPPYIVHIKDTNSPPLHPIHISRIVTSYFPKGMGEVSRIGKGQVAIMMDSVADANKIALKGWYHSRHPFGRGPSLHQRKY
ncbi:PREDICTED: proline-rich receptor-like protein kinase PERK5 [Vollenhovia emeryi]|uniref:proline-rich receptor-like protein kinase PERK5 n=1 Tax=Vollenhovia emeryi TaxID=411798 RepID=UPI0005F41F22|nr:PREDICTED: proline-rich receptor-like protein kinase PERK5 [Vollenhovia emeryi]